MKKTRNSRQAFAGSEQMSFLPEPDFNLRLPSKNTLAYRALSLMLQGEKISHPDFQDKTSSWRLAAHIHILNKLGWPVETISAQLTVSNMSRNRHIYRYFLNEKIIDKVKKLSGGAVW